MKITSLVVWLIFISTKSYSQIKSDTAINCCDKSKETFNNETEDGTPARFPGGTDGWSRWLRKWLNSKEKQLQENKLQGNCQFKFSIDTTGKIKDLIFCSMQGTMAETIIRDIISRSLLWQPAVNYKRGKIVQSFCQTLAFEFGDSEE